MSIGWTIWIILQVLIGFHLVLPVLLYLLHFFTRKKSGDAAVVATEPDYAIIVTAYEQVDLIPQVVRSILALNYTNYLVYIVADKCDVSGLQFNNEKIVVLRPETTLASNIRSHFYAIRNFKRPHTHLTIIDSDNLVDTEYLVQLNNYFNRGFKAVQGVRKEKNLNTTYACLDAASDIYYRFIDRKLLFDVGSSASLSGSGMAFTTQLYRDCLEHLEMSGAGFDKILQFEILKRKLRIAFASQAIVYDEKTSKSDQLVKQRARWLNTWFRFFALGARMTLLGIRNINWNQFIFGVLLLRPPLFILLALSFICFAANIIVMPIAALCWVIAVCLFISMFYVALNYFKADKRIYKSLRGIPLFFFYQLSALLKVNKANKLSVATKHDQHTSINDIP